MFSKAPDSTSHRFRKGSHCRRRRSRSIDQVRKGRSWAAPPNTDCSRCGIVPGAATLKEYEGQTDRKKYWTAARWPAPSLHLRRKCSTIAVATRHASRALAVHPASAATGGCFRTARARCEFAVQSAVPSACRTTANWRPGSTPIGKCLTPQLSQRVARTFLFPFAQSRNVRPEKRPPTPAEHWRSSSWQQCVRQDWSVPDGGV